MKKLKLLFAACALLLGVSNAMAAELPASGSGEYVLKNVGTGTYLKGDAYWGTKAVVWDDPYFVTLTYVSEGKYTIKSQQNNGGEKQYVTSGDDPYVDGASAEMTFTEVDAVNHYYTINNGNGNLYAVLQTEDGADIYKVMAGDVTTNYAKWQIISRAELVAALDAASSSNPVDATFFLKDAGIDVKSVNATAWTTKTNVDLGGGGNAGHNAESWNKSSFSLSQTVTGLPNGKYRATCHGYYRWNTGSGGNNNSAAVAGHASGDEVLNAIFFAGGKETPLMSVAGDAGATAFCETMGWADNTPNNQWQAAACFTKGFYLNTLNDVVVTDGTLTLGVKKTTQAGTDWAVFDEFKLYYLGEDLDIYVDAYNDAVVAANAVDQSAPMLATALSALQTAISTYGTGVDKSSKEALLTATTALSTATSNAKVSIDAYLNANNALAGMNNIVSGTNFYTEEALSAYGYATNQAAYDARTMTNEVASALVNPEAITGWHAANTIDDLLMSVWDENPEAWESYHVNTWSTEGESDGSNFKVPFIEYWTGDGNALGVKSMTATINGLEDGLYKVSAWVRVRAKNGTAATDATGITIDVNGGDKVDVTQGTQIGESQFQHATYEAQGLVVDGVLTFKFNVEDGNNISWLSYKNVKYIKIRDLEPSEYKDGLETAIGNATAIIDAKANVGSNVFQIPESAWSTLSAAKNTAQGVYDDGDATANEVKQAIEDMNAAIEAYGNAELNAPDAEKHYNIIVATTGHAKFNNAVVESLGATSANNPTGYSFNASATPNANLAQAVKFTQVSGNTYNISFETSEGTVYLTYGSLNGSAAGWATQQIQGTTDSSKKGEFKISATATANVFNIYNTLTNSTIACQTGGSLYTEAGNADFTIAEASEATVSMAIDADVKYATRIFPFTPTTWPDNVVAYSCEASSDNVLTLDEVAQPVANTPYILFADFGSTGSISGWGTAAAASYTVGWLTGVYEDTKATAGTYVLQNNNGNVAFYVVEAEKEPTVGAYRCYLSVPAQEGRSAYFFPGSGEVVTGINAAVKALTSGKAQIFNASGAQIPALQKGMNIIILEDGTTQKIVVQ